ncbi:MAG: hypothetical protein ACI89D_000541, partial [Bermanella sp.]
MSAVNERPSVKNLLVVAGVYFGYGEIRERAPSGVGSFSDTSSSSSPPSFSGPKAFDQRPARGQVQGDGLVKKLLPDDNKGSRHQRFILTL